ncbi:hypothetical protein H8E52_09000 [bacterium]|nr:hypothetical protein [bacterium]
MSKKNIDLEMSSRFTCPKCQSTGAKVDRLAFTGAGISRFIDLQHMRFMSVSCIQCGYTEMYNLGVLEGSDTLGDILDIILER